jgi:hypothetical protein
MDRPGTVTLYHEAAKPGNAAAGGRHQEKLDARQDARRLQCLVEQLRSDMLEQNVCLVTIPNKYFSIV